MAATKEPDQDVIKRLAGRGEDALQRLADMPGGTKALKAFNDLKARVDELARRARGVEELELRVAKLEKDLATLKRAQTPKPPRS